VLIYNYCIELTDAILFVYCDFFAVYKSVACLGLSYKSHKALTQSDDTD